ncbi:MAG: hypothetical protein V3W18_12345 [candidate division Zixibacteria bacterium]
MDKYKTEAGPDVYRCDVCDKPMLERNCNLICINCGYTRDCTDP